jgi:hypothetical protein
MIDASGTWTQPNPLGGTGLPALGEPDAASRIAYGLPDVLGRDRDRYAGRRTVVVGAGHSAATSLLALAELQRQAPSTEVVWAVRSATPRPLVGNGSPEADEVIAATGFRPDHAIAAELRLALEPVLESAAALGPLVDPNVHTCGTVPAHGMAELVHPEPGYVVVGMKSYGRAPTFLPATGYQQVRSVVAALAGDHAGAAHRDTGPPAAALCARSRHLLASAQRRRQLLPSDPQPPAGRRQRRAERRRTGMLPAAVPSLPGMSSGRQHLDWESAKGRGGAW